ncbi:MAG: hypothetical protein ACTHN5_09990 [Phycisphaerae bacterium]
MFGWLFSSCPVDPMAKAWIERRLRWLMDEFGSDLFLNARNILPTNDFFPDKIESPEQGATVLVERTCEYMRVPTSTIELDFFSDKGRPQLVNSEGHALGGAAGLYSEGDGRFHIHINRSQLHDPMHLVGTIAHELAHVRLLGENRISRDAFDNELLTDLTVVFHGMGIFLANVPRNWQSDNKRWPGTDLVRPEYMSLPMFAYALALRSQMRFETSFKWTKHLRPAVRAEFKQSMRFLNKQLHSPKPTN